MAHSNSDLPRPTVHLIHGLPGSGKTTFARELARRTGGVLLNHDAHRLAHFGIPAEPEAFAADTPKIEEALWQEGKRWIAEGRDLILDHGFWSRDDRRRAEERVRQLGGTCKWYSLDCPFEESVRRVVQRNRVLPEGSYVIPEAALETFRSRFEAMGDDEPHESVRAGL